MQKKELIIMKFKQNNLKMNGIHGVQQSGRFAQLRLSGAAPLPSATAQSGQHATGKSADSDSEQNEIEG